MPFPLAHPAAVLPLRRLSPKYLSFPALLLGSVIPDAGYLGGRLEIDHFSHGLWSGPVFGVAAGLVALGLLYGGWSPRLGLIPERWKSRLLPEGLPSLGPLWMVVLSLALGAWTHVVWDGFTHKGGWAAGCWPALAAPLTQVAGRNLRIVTVLWYLSSFAGVACVFLAYARRRGPSSGSGWPQVRDALIFASLILPVELAHHLVKGVMGAAMVLVASVVLVLGASKRARESLNASC